MIKKGLEIFIILLIILSIWVIIICLDHTWRITPLIENILEEFNRDTRGRRTIIDQSDVLMIWRDIVSKLVFILCTCLICLSYLVSKK